MGIKRIWKTEEVFHLPDGDLRYYGHLGIPHYEEMDDGSVQASMPVTHALLNGHGTVQGGAVASLCDIVGAAYMRILVSLLK